MIRDFSDDAMWKLINLIDEISDEKWCDMTDTIGDALYIGLDIKDYIDNVETYHKKILDKNDISRSDIEKIFSDVEEVAMHYKAIFREAAETIQQQAEYVKKLAFVMDGNIVLKDINSSMKEVLLNMENSQIEFYMAQMRRGEDTGEYDWEYITELFRSNPEDVSTMAYAAMIIVFNDMELEEQEKFIEIAYTKYGELHSVSNLRIQTDYPIQKRELMLSDVFKRMVVIYGEVITNSYFLEGKSTEITKLCGNYNILSSVITHADKVYVYGGGEEAEVVDIKISSLNDVNKYDYCIEFDAVGSLVDINGFAVKETIVINVYEKGDYKKLETALENAAQDILLTHYENIGAEGGKELSEGILSIVLDELINESVITNEIGGIQTIVSCVSEVNEAIDTNQDIDDIRNLLADADVYEALRLNASVSTSGKEYSIHLFSINSDELSPLIQEYNAWTDTVNGYEKMENDVEEIKEAIQTGKLENIDGIEDYVKWYVWCSNKTQESNESEDINVTN